MRAVEISHEGILTTTYLWPCRNEAYRTRSAKHRQGWRPITYITKTHTRPVCHYGEYIRLGKPNCERLWDSRSAGARSVGRSGKCHQKSSYNVGVVEHRVDFRYIYLLLWYYSYIFIMDLFKQRSYYYVNKLTAIIAFIAWSVHPCSLIEVRQSAA